MPCRAGAVEQVGGQIDVTERDEAVHAAEGNPNELLAGAFDAHSVLVDADGRPLGAEEDGLDVGIMPSYSCHVAPCSPPTRLRSATSCGRQ